MQTLTCDNPTLFSATLSLADKCKYLTEACAEDQETINFFEIFLCKLDGRTGLFLLLAVIAILLIFKFICAVVDEYIAPAIVYLSEKMKLSEALAGVTLLAFANGAGDVITAIVASDSKEGVSYNVGALYGAGLFVLTLVVALTIKTSPKSITVYKSTIYRDTGFYILATLLTVGIAYTGSITWVSSLAMLALYLALVIVVMIQDRIEAKRNKAKSLIMTTEFDEEEEPLQEDEVVRRKTRRFTDIFNALPKRDLQKLKAVFNQLFHYVKSKAKIRSKDYSTLSQVIDIIDFPFVWIRKLTIPPVEVEEYNHKLTIAWPIFGILFSVWVTTLTPSIDWLFIIPVALALILFFSTYRPKTNSELPSYFVFITIIGTVNGILWTKFLCSILVDLLTFVGVLTNLSTTYLGLTIIAVGNALPDGLTTIAIAKQGQAMMGITGGVAGQLFGLLVGFGISMFKKTMTQGPQPFELFDMSKISENILDLVVICVALVTLLFMFFYGIFNNRKYDNRMANILIFIYVSFVLISTVIAVYQAFG